MNVSITGCNAFISSGSTLSRNKATVLEVLSNDSNGEVMQDKSRRAIVRDAAVLMGLVTTPNVVLADDNEEAFESIAAKAARMAKDVETEEAASIAKRESEKSSIQTSADSRTIYDFSVPVANKDIPFAEFIDQKFPEGEDLSERARVKANRNIKQDDPLARKNIPEMITLAAKYGKNGDFAVVAVPTDQGYYEPDTSALIRLKMDREYGYGINPATHLTDKMNLLGTGAHPLMRWIEGTCRTPAGLGKIQGNFEKFLVDGSTGKAIRRYPRKYSPYDMQDDIKAIIDGKPLPPAGSNYLEEWRAAAEDAKQDTYRFQKGLNVFDQ
eukprot:CAMPEP_0116005502 /NCGR_PEP_ID=MMETSP0321-20121206/1202_1 /TAXON_ID=163516 /ORGANISM="Leptocylindrus danicus var. danicus, Strain B650" /LENGTH=325 /DNA_ID=CAMNT_0003473939 /DNA_START=161 /DNA_END=1139 /DNA_ORIENTATION=+